MVKPGWRPDVATIDWALSVIQPADIVKARREDSERRPAALGLGPKSDEYWLLGSDVATEAVLSPALRYARSLQDSTEPCVHGALSDEPPTEP
jgi:hypothetical protein